jgi:hypothetical protein
MRCVPGVRLVECVPLASLGGRPLPSAIADGAADVVQLAPLVLLRRARLP